MYINNCKEESMIKESERMINASKKYILGENTLSNINNKCKNVTLL